MAAASNLPRSGAVSRGYNFASTWEQNAPLTEHQHAAISSLAHAVVDRPIPLNLSQEKLGQDNGLSSSTEDSTLKDSGAIETVMVNTHQFYKWFTELEASMKSETEEKYRHYVNTLTERIQTCDGILDQVDETLHLFNELQLQHQAVATKTKTLHDACDRLLMEKQRLIEFAEALRSKLNYFDELENVATNFYSPNMKVGNGHFLPLLKRLDECISYVERNPQYAESSVYLVKFRQLQSRALGMIRSHVLSVLKSASSQVLAVIKGSGSGKTAVSEGVEASVIYVRFKAAANELKPVLMEIESRSSRKEYAHVLAECHRLYCEQRLSLVRGIVHQRISEFAKKESLPSLTRSGCAYLMQPEENQDIFKTWYPPLEKTLSCLSKLYRCLEPAVFTGLAQEAVEVCSTSIQKASKLITKRSSPMDGQLFLIKHLLILREQIAPFDIEFSVTHKELDFSHLLEHLRRILRGQASLFDWSRSTSLARTLSPRVLESQIDAKKELEKNLKSTCEEFIMSVTKLVVDPMLSFVTKVTAVKVALSSGHQEQKLDSVLAKPLKNQAFASPDKLAELVQKVGTAIQQELPKVMEKLKLYLQNPSTRTILFKPIKTNIVEAHVQVQSLIKSEYSAEEMESIGMISIQDLNTQLDTLL